MKKLLVVLGFPAVLLAMWVATSQAGPSSSAEVRLSADRVLDLRGTVVARLATLGGVRTSERTDFANGGSSELTFRLPAARLEQALATLGEAGGAVQSQEIDLEDATGAADGVTRRLDDLNSCLSELSRSGVDVAALRKDLGACQDRLRDVSTSLEAAAPLATDATLTVVIDRPTRSNVLLVAAIAVLALALAVMAALTLRSARQEPVFDGRDEAIDLTEEVRADIGRRWN